MPILKQIFMFFPIFQFKISHVYLKIRLYNRPKRLENNKIKVLIFAHQNVYDCFNMSVCDYKTINGIIIK